MAAHAWLSIAALALLVSPTVRAEEPAPPVVVLLFAAQDEGAANTLLGAVQAQLGDLPVQLSIERSAEFPATLPDQVGVAADVAARLSATTVFWFDVSIPEQIFVYLAERGGSRVLVRAVDATGEVERLESTAVIVRGLVQAVLEGGTIGIQSPPASPPPQPTPPAPGESPAASPVPEPAMPVPARSWLGLQLAYAVDFFSDQVTVVQGVAAGLLFHVDPNWSLFAAYRVLTDADASGGGVDLSVSRHPMELGVRFRWPLGDWDLGASFFGVADYLTRETVSRSSGMAVVGNNSAWLGGIGLVLHTSYRIAGSFRVFLDGGIDALVNRVEYVVQTSDGQSVVLRSWYVCPTLLLGLSVDLV
jgi:hypothetical protein